METSHKYPTLSRYCFSWCWNVQFRVIKPAKRKKEWIDLAEVQGVNATDAHKSLRFLCERKGWKLVEVFLIQPTSIAFAFDRDAANDAFLTKAEKDTLFPRPATEGRIFRPPSAAQLKQARQVERQKRAIWAAFPLLAEELIATEFTS